MVKSQRLFERIAEALGTNETNKIAKMLDISPGSVSQWKSRGKISIDNLLAIGKLGEVTIEWLLTGEGEKKRTIALQEKVHQNSKQKETLVQGKSIESIEVKVLGDYEIKLAPNRIEIRGTIKSFQRRT